MEVETLPEQISSERFVVKCRLEPNSDVDEFKRRMLEWPNPVEYVNNMYGCHPLDKNTEYFKVVFDK